MKRTKIENLSDYRKGYKVGYNKGYEDCKNNKMNIVSNNSSRPTGHWILKDCNWYCSRCGTKNEQAHEDYCCKCGTKMYEEEAAFDEDNESC